MREGVNAVSYEDSLRQARELLILEINELKEQLARKEQNLKKLDAFLKEPYGSSGNGTIDKSTKLSTACIQPGHPITAKQSSRLFKYRQDVNESTIIHLAPGRKQKPTEIEVDGNKIGVSVIKMADL